VLLVVGICEIKKYISILILMMKLKKHYVMIAGGRKGKNGCSIPKSGRNSNSSVFLNRCKRGNISKNPKQNMGTDWRESAKDGDLSDFGSMGEFCGAGEKDPQKRV
jgi:hypothetical protein